MGTILKSQESLMNYAAWYAMRYLPSFRKLYEVLMKKSSDNEKIVSTVMEEMATYISEERTVDSLVRMYIDQSKTYHYIRQKLKLKQFEENIIVAILDSYKDSFISWNLYKQTITHKIMNYLEKKKSRKYIIGTLVQKYPDFKQEITVLLGTLYLDETASIQGEFVKLRRKYDMTNQKERQKVIQKLSGKGFLYDDIRKVIRENE